MSSVTREHRAEAARLFWSSIDAEVQHWIDTGNTDFTRDDNEPYCEGIAGQAQPIAQALAERDARIGELAARLRVLADGLPPVSPELIASIEAEPLDDVTFLPPGALDTTKAQLARVVGALRELRDDVCGSTVCVSRELRTRVDSILKELDHA